MIKSMILNQKLININCKYNYINGMNMSTLSLTNVSREEGSYKKSKRVGRGRGSGIGKMSGRGHKGTKAREGNHGFAGFEGGTTPFWRRVPKLGFSNKQFSKPLNELNISKLQEAIDKKIINPDNIITMKSILDSGISGKYIKHGVKLLGKGELKTPVKIEVTRASKEAIDKVEKVGGIVVASYYNQLGLRALLKPESFVKKGKLLPKRARPPPKDAKYYLDWENNRGYLSQEAQLMPLKGGPDFRGLTTNSSITKSQIINNIKQ